AENAYAVPFYADEGRDLAEFIRQQLSAARIRFDSAAVAAITARLSPNRAVNMQELQKLILYIGEGNTLSAIDAEACLADSNDSSFDDLTLSLFDKKPAALLTALEKMLGEGLPPIVALRSCGKYIERLLKVKTALQSGKDIEAAMNGLKPPVFFKQADAFKRHVARYSEAQLLAMAAVLLQAEKLAKLNSPLSETIIRQEMLKLAA
ncbi:MAG: DNA polymerase III subunit delta, partial [Dongiaceae bacterium]